MEKDENGLWSVDYKTDTPGFKWLEFSVDGTKVINNLAPIAFGASRPVNFVDFPCDSDFYEIKDVPHGTVAQDFFFSETTGEWENCMVYLPPRYFTEPERAFPVLYLQHGHGENERGWVYQGKVNFIMDNLIADGNAVPCIIVMNNGMIQPKNADGVHTLDRMMIGDVIIKDCIPFIEKRYRVKPGKENRAMAGLSMGSMQTSIVTLTHPELFAYAGIFSGFLGRLGGNTDTSHLALLHDREAFKKEFKVFFRIIGSEDQFKPVFENETAMLDELGITEETCPNYHTGYYPGTHEWLVWRYAARDFLKMIFK